MDVDEFMATVLPRKRTSQLTQYESEILKLKAKGYTNEQIQSWLAKNQIHISREAVRRFVKKHAKANDDNALQRSVVDVLPDSTQGSNAQRIQRRLAEQQVEASKTRFKHDKTGNN
ncbi:MAG: hypothetical protein JO002_11335 [Burkholderiaceae bacterium]|nr:hypothetical protein [Burkholderiaceae bacterium]